MPARQQQLETQFQRKFFVKSFSRKISWKYIPSTQDIYVWVSTKDDVRSCSTEFFKTEKEKEGRGGNEIFWWTPFLSQFPKAHLEFHAYVSRKKAPKYAFFFIIGWNNSVIFFRRKNPKADWCRLRVSSGRFLLLTTTSTTTTVPVLCLLLQPTYISIWPSSLGEASKAPSLHIFFFWEKTESCSSERK